MADRAGGYTEEDGLLRRRLDRADFLRLIGAGATLPFVPASLAALGARPGEAQTAPIPQTPADLVAGGGFPIGVWWPPPPSETNQFRYQQIADADFNFVIGGNGVTNENATRAALEAAEATGLKFLLTDDPGPRDGPGLQDLISGADTGGAGAQSAESEDSGIMRYLNEQDDPASAPDSVASGLALSTVQEKIRQRVQELRARYPEAEYPALAGINLFDEPSRSMFGRLKFAGAEVRAQFPDTRDLPYANVYPSYAARSALGTRSYGDYLDLYLKGAGRLPLLSFDHYPLLSGTGITDSYFSNWAAIRSRAIRYRIPSWILIQSVGFEGTIISPARRRPNGDELFWQVNVSLAYGTKGVQYFTYWTPESDPPRVQFRDALIARNAEGQWDTTPLYNRAGAVNEYLKAVGRQLLPLTSERVMHTGLRRSRPGAPKFEADGWLRAASGSPVILGRFFETSLRDPERYLLVVNRSFANVASTRLTVSDSVLSVSRFDAASTSSDPYVSVELKTSPRSFRVDLEAGRAALYRLSRTAG